MAITDRTPSMRDLAPELLGGRHRPRHPNRASSTFFRPALLRSGSRTTFTVQGDWPEDAHGWFETSNATYRPSATNEIEYYRDGDEAYAAFCEAAETTRGEGDFILILGWSCYHDFVLSTSRRAGSLAGLKLIEILSMKARAGVDVRILLFHQMVREIQRNTRTRLMRPIVDSILSGIPGGQFLRWPVVENWLREHTIADAASVELTRDAINDLGLRNARCELDQGHRPRACHHNKIWIVKGSEGLCAFYGGIDFNPDRLSRTSAGRPMHDVHARARGPAAQALLEMAILRWNHADIAYRTAFREWLAGQVNLPPIRGRTIENWSRFRVANAGSHGSALVHPCQTIGNPEIEAESGQRSDIWPELRRAIGRARRFIYVEDQYFWSLDAARELGRALPNIAHLTILIPPERTGAGLNLRRSALRVLWETAATPENRAKIGVYERTGDEHSYIHAKLMIFDDEYTMMGSANINRRGYEHDGETNAGVVDRAQPLTQEVPARQRWSASIGATLTHKLRIRLWTEHLAFRGEVMQSRLWDGVAAGYYWRQAHHSPHAPPVIEGVLRNPARWWVPVPRGHVQEHSIQNHPWWAWVEEFPRSPSPFDRGILDPGHEGALEEELEEGEASAGRFGD